MEIPTGTDLEKMMKMAQAFAEMQENDREVSAQAREPHIPPLILDEAIQTPQMKAIKAAIPYAEPSGGKMLAIMIKLMELKTLISDYENRIPIAVDEEQRFSEMLNAMKPHCNRETLHMIESVERFQEMQMMMQFMGQMRQGNEA